MIFKSLIQQKEEEKRKMEQIIDGKNRKNGKSEELNIIISIIVLNANGLNISIKS